MRTAFKEWAIVCEALASGRQVVILRKGGIAEQGGVFRIETPEFLLLPTAFHQSAESVLPEMWPALEELAKSPADPETLVCRHFARVAEAVEIDSLAALEALRGQHIWADQVVTERFHRWRKDSIHALIVRVYALPAPVAIPMRPQYAGCKSWIELEDDISTEGAVAVLDEEQFARKAAAVRNSLTLEGKS